MVTGDGRAKVLDFGLAKLTEPLPAGPAGSVLSEHPSTETGLIVGTVSYMSPEQAEGKKLDARSDIFSFGSLLYEMLTGRRAFRRDSPALTLAAILHLEPPSLPAGLPRDVERVIARCLRKDPARRFQHMDDVRVWLEDLKQDSKPDLERAMLGAREPAGATAVGRWYPLGLSIAAGLLLIAATVLGYLAFRRAPEVARPIRFTIIAPENTTLYEPRVSPDSERIIFDVAITDGKRQVYVRRLDSPELTAVPGTEGASDSFWSPDSRSIGFYVDGRLMRVDLAGGQPQTLCTGLTDVTYGDWNRDDVILLGGKGRGLVRVPAQGGAPVAVTVLDPRKRELAHIAPVFLPDGKRFVYLARQAEGQLSAKWGSLDGKESGELPFRSAWLQYAPPSYLLFPRDGAVFAQQLDLKNMKLTGAPWIAGGPVREFADQIYQFSASGNGVLAWTTAATRTASELVWFDASGRRGGTVGPPAEYGSPALAPDGRRLAVDIYDPAAKTRDIWILDPNRGSRTRFTFDPADDFSPVWSPDGSRIAWTSDRRGVRDLYVKPASGTGQDEPLLVSPLPKQADDWSRDGGYLVYNQPVEGGPAFSIFALPLSPGAERKPLPVFGREFAERQGRLSPDSRLLAYMSNESSRQSQVFVQPFPPTGARWQVSPSGGNEPRWRADGKELYYLSGNKLMAADVKTDGVGFEAGVPRTLFEARFVSFLGRRNRYAIARDGRFLLNVMPEQTPIERSSITVLVNWQAAPGK
jgi:Tol biopolymer transport system component